MRMMVSALALAALVGGAGHAATIRLLLTSRASPASVDDKVGSNSQLDQIFI